MRASASRASKKKRAASPSTAVAVAKRRRPESTADIAKQVAVADPGASSSAPLTPEPLTASNAAHRAALAPASLWPDEACSENDGLGWDVKILAASRGCATIRFTAARDAAGRRHLAHYHVPLSALVAR